MLRTIVVVSLFKVAPIVGVLCFGPYFVMKYFVSFLMFCNHLDGEKRAGCFASSSCFVTVSSLWHSVLWLFLAVPLVGLWCVIVVFLDHAHFPFFSFQC